MTKFSKDINFSGLSQTEAEKILKIDGYNELPSQKKQNWFIILIKILTEPMILLLIISGLVYFFIGEIKDTLMLLTSVFVIIGITFFQEKKTEKVLDALKDLSSPRTLVIRDGQQQRIPGREVVKGDIIIIREGDRVPADATILSCQNIVVDESLLTGESLPVRKTEWDKKTKNQRPGGEDLPFVYSGTMVTSGYGIAKVNCTGVKTEIGKIGKSLENIKEEETLLKKETTKIVKIVATIGFILCLTVILIYILIKNDIIGGFLAGLTLGMAILPEEFPIILIVFLTLGAWRISKNKVLTRNSAAIETLGAATVLCTDKTGTLTMNKMQLSSLYAENSFFEINEMSPKTLAEQFKILITYSVLASQKDPFDPIEKELKKIEKKYLNKNTSKDLQLIKEYPINKNFLALTHVWQSKKNEFIIASKGAPETILDLCHLDNRQREEILEKVKEMSEKGLRVLGVAKTQSSLKEIPEKPENFNFEFIGLLGFIDPIRKTAKGAVEEAYNAGIRVIMITGDYPGTAQFIAKKIGIKNSENYLTGEDLEKLNRQELKEKIKTINIFARVVPEQKLLIVNALKDNGQIVAMTGDGVNDAPALKTAHIGIAMGERGTDVAREASSLVLLNDEFSSIVVAIRLGRRIYNNLKRAMGYIISVHIPIAGMSLLPLFFDLPSMLFPAHIAFLELIIDPACSIVFESEKEDENIMKKPPRDLKQPIFNFKTVIIHVIQGLGVLVAIFALFIYAIKTGKNELETRSFIFISLVIANLLLIIINLSWTENFFKIIKSANKILFITIASTLICLILIVFIPFLANLFHLVQLGLKDILLIIIAMIFSLSWFEILKYFKKIN